MVARTEQIVTPQPARRIALDVIMAVRDSDAYANLLLPVRLGRAKLSEADAGLATELTYGTLRMQGYYDAVITLAAGRDVSKIDAPVLDVLRLVAVAAAILLDVLVLASMLARIGEYGLTANRVAALGLNVLLLANLAATAWLLGRVVFARDGVVRVERWQTDYLPVFAVWVVAVVVVVPGVFGFR